MIASNHGPWLHSIVAVLWIPVFVQFLSFGDLFYSEYHPNTREGKGESPVWSHLFEISSLQGRCVTLGTQEPFRGADGMSDWIESETPFPSMDTGLGGSCVSNPCLLRARPPGLLCCQGALFYPCISKREKHQLGTLWESPWRLALSMI